MYEFFAGASVRLLHTQRPIPGMPGQQEGTNPSALLRLWQCPLEMSFLSLPIHPIHWNRPTCFFHAYAELASGGPVLFAAAAMFWMGPNPLLSSAHLPSAELNLILIPTPWYQCFHSVVPMLAPGAPAQLGAASNRCKWRD